MSMAQSNLSGQRLAPSTVTVIIPTSNQSQLLQICLQHLNSQTFQPTETLIVQNGPPGPAAAVSLDAQNVTWIHLPTNQGTSVAFNRGLAESRKSPYFFLLNDDTELEPDCLALLVKALEDNPDYSVAVPKLLQASNPSLLDGAGDELLLGGGAYRVGRGLADEGQFDRRERVLGACAAAALYRGSLFEDIGNFDEDYFAYLEDIDLSLRALLRGHRSLFVPEARVRHRGGATFGSSFHPEIIRLTTRNQILTIIKNYPLPILLRLCPRMMVYQVLWMGFAIRKRAFGAWCMGLLGLIPKLRRALGKRKLVRRLKTISNRDLLRQLAESESRIWRWHTTTQSGRRPQLLTIYFKIFGPPPRPKGLESASNTERPGSLRA
jgi:GT2 family glycosyltransferase